MGARSVLRAPRSGRRTILASHSRQLGALARDDKRRLRILENGSEPGGRARRVERQIGGAGLEHGKQRDDRVRRPADLHADDRSGCGAVLTQPVSELRRSRVELRVRQPGPPVVDGESGGRGADVRVEPIEDGPAVVGFWRSTVSEGEQQLSFG